MMSNKDLIKAFQNTNYVVLSQDFDEGQIVLNIGLTSASLTAYYPSLKSWAFITAWNPLPEILSYSENRRRNIDLQNDLNNLGIQYLKGYGTAQDESWNEESLFIINITKPQSIILGKKYGQKAIVFGLANEPAELIMLNLGS